MTNTATKTYDDCIYIERLTYEAVGRNGRATIPTIHEETNLEEPLIKEILMNLEGDGIVRKVSPEEWSLTTDFSSALSTRTKQAIGTGINCLFEDVEDVALELLCTVKGLSDSQSNLATLAFKDEKELADFNQKYNDFMKEVAKHTCVTADTPIKDTYKFTMTMAKQSTMLKAFWGGKC